MTSGDTIILSFSQYNIFSLLGCSQVLKTSSPSTSLPYKHLLYNSWLCGCVHLPCMPWFFCLEGLRVSLLWGLWSIFICYLARFFEAMSCEQLLILLGCTPPWWALTNQVCTRWFNDFLLSLADRPLVNPKRLCLNALVAAVLMPHLTDWSRAWWWGHSPEILMEEFKQTERDIM